jgi:hypothetical protein
MIVRVIEIDHPVDVIQYSFELSPPSDSEKVFPL